MTRFRIGQRVRNTRARHGNAVVTAITERGFAYKLLQPHSYGPRHGWFQEGESFQDEGWELVETNHEASHGTTH